MTNLPISGRTLFGRQILPGSRAPALAPLPSQLQAIDPPTRSMGARNKASSFYFNLAFADRVLGQQGGA
jgi:hypothetical protein